MLLPQRLEVLWAAGPFTPRHERVVTHHELWYRYVPESGNWHDGTYTRKIEAFSAATGTRWFGPAVPLCPELCCSPPVAPTGRGHAQGFRLYSMRRYVSSLVVVGLTGGHAS